MVTMEWVIRAGAVLGAAAGIWRAVVFFVHLSDNVKDMHRHTFENYMSCLRLTIMSHDMPIGERIIAAKKYVDAGGNGEIKKFAIEELHINDVQD